MRTRYLPLVLLCVPVVLGAEPARDRYGDPLPQGAIARLGTIRLRTDYPTVNATFLHGGKTLATISDNVCLDFWNPATGAKTGSHEFHIPGGTGRCRFSVDGKTLLISGAWDSPIHFFDTISGAKLRTLTYSVKDTVRAIALARDGKTLVADHQGIIVVWDVVRGKPRHEFKELYNASVPSGLPALTEDGKQLVLPRADGSLRLVDTANGKEIRTLDARWGTPGKRPNERLVGATLSPDGRYLGFLEVGSRRIVLCDLATGKRVREWTCAANYVAYPTFGPDSRFLAVKASEGIYVYGVDSGKEIRHLPAGGNCTPLAFAPDGRTLATRAYCKLYLWDVSDGRPLHAPRGHTGPTASLVFFPDGKRLLSGDGTELILWDTTTGRVLAERGTSGLHENSLHVDGDGKNVAFFTGDGVVHQWQPHGHHEQDRSLSLPDIYHAALSPDGRTAAIFNGERHLHLHDLKGGKGPRQRLLAKDVWIAQLLFSPNSRLLVAARSDGPLRLWDRDTGKLLRECKSDTRTNYSSLFPVFAGDGRSLAAFDGDHSPGYASPLFLARGQLCIYETHTGRQRLAIDVPRKVSALAYSADGRFVAYGDGDGRVDVHETNTGKSLAVRHGQQGAIHSLAFSREGRQLASAGATGTILVWKVPEGKSLPATLTAQERLSFWQALKDVDAERGYRALAGLAAAPTQAIPLIKERFRIPPQPPELMRLIADLDDDSFPVREQATRQLAEAGAEAADLLRQTLTNKPSLEVKRRIEQLLDRLDKDGASEHLRGLRAIEVLERIGSPQAKALLRELAAKSLPADLHEEVQASLRRLDEKP